VLIGSRKSFKITMKFDLCHRPWHTSVSGAVILSLILFVCVCSFIPVDSLQLRLPITANRRMAVPGWSTSPCHSSPRSTTTRRSSSTSILASSHDPPKQETLATLKRRLTREFVRIGAPALIQLAAEPLASLVDTAYLGRLGPEILGGAGVAVSAQYAVSKLYNDPLLRTSISLVAAQEGKARRATAGDPQVAKDLGIAVSSALLLAAAVGVIQMFVYLIFCQSITRGMGVSPSSPMWFSAVSYLQIRSLGTPAATLWLVTNGIYRGLGDTRTPLVYSLVFTLLNIVLDPIFIFTFQWGASGAAAGTALAQYIALIPLLRALHRKVPIDILGQIRDLQACLAQYVQAGSLVLFRTLGKVLAYSVCARYAALLGPVAAAAYNLTFQLGFATTQICESVAVAVQTMLARELSDTTTYAPATRARLVRHLIQTSLWLGGGVAAALSGVSYLRRHWIVPGLTTNTAVQSAALTIFPAVMLTQVLKGLAYPVNGIGMGGLDWWYSMAVMWLANLSCLGLLRYFASKGTVTLYQIWWALALFMGTQVVLGLVRVESKTGVWKVLRFTRTAAVSE
jgi:putative MATE family efflux protein